MKNISLAILTFFIVISCDDDHSVSIDKETLATNEWIIENMEQYYYWNDKLPDNVNYKGESDSEEYFYKLIYSDEDKWSWITDDYASLSSEYAGTPVTMGYNPAFYRLTKESNDIFIVVKYVYPGSAAEIAGLERGDIILSINNTGLNTTNYYTLYSGTEYSVELGTISNNTKSYSGESIELTAATTTTNPAIYSDVFELNGTKIGYLVYVEFVSGDNDMFLTELETIFSNFKSEGISDLIVDLRYNPGGEINAAAYLASEIAPAVNVTNQDVLVNLYYNDELQSYFEYYKNQYPENLSYTFNNKVTQNADLDRIYFLTTSKTASASELLITGLEPYMDVVHIGEATFGKYMGAWIIPDDNEEWAIIPIVTKYANINGYTDFVKGLTPDYIIYDNLLSAVPFGDTSDPMVAKAINLITGISETASSKSSTINTFKQINPVKEELKSNLFIPVQRKK